MNKARFRRPVVLYTNDGILEYMHTRAAMSALDHGIPYSEIQHAVWGLTD